MKEDSDIIKVLKSSKLTPSEKVNVISELNNKQQHSKNLNHVPCKFFKMGSCQAGQSCPFSHSMDTVKSQNCKYFQKGNCKFGIKCALAHVMPDGSKVTNSFSSHSQQQHHHPPNSSSSLGSIWSSNSPQNNWSGLNNTSATTSVIVDDSDDDYGELDLVPSSLNDLLTPQELVRRRSSQSKFDRSVIYKNMFNNGNGSIIEQGDTQFIMD